MACRIIKSNESTKKEVFRYGSPINKRFIITIILLLLVFSIEILRSSGFESQFMEVLQIIIGIGVFASMLWMFGYPEYQVEVEGKKLTYKQGNEKLEIILPCTIAIAHNGILTTKGFYERNEKVVLDYRLEFDADDKDTTTGKTIKEFLEEANKRAMQVS
ncbi:MAG: hypothetical protein HFJ28_00515 [Clostridia bacterium]|nr:hypothetical protein [Clostridia bacterium]